MNSLSTILAALAIGTSATVASAAIPTDAANDVTPIAIHTVAPDLAIDLSDIIVAANPPAVEDLIDRLKSRSDDGTLNEQDMREVRELYQELRANAVSFTSPFEAVQYSPEVERLIERLKRRSDDGTLNAQDYLEIQRLHRQTSEAPAQSDAAMTIEVAQWHPEAEKLKERLESRSDDGTLGSGDYREVQRLHRELTS